VSAHFLQSEVDFCYIGKVTPEYIMLHSKQTILTIIFWKHSS